MKLNDVSVFQLNVFEIFVISISSWFIAQLLKFIGSIFVQKKITWSVILDTGGMPSSHTATVVSFTTSMAILYTVNSFEFAISFLLTLIIMHDAFKVRRAVGQNTLTFKHFFKETIDENYKKIEKELELLEIEAMQLGGKKSNRAMREINKKKKLLADLHQLEEVLGHTFFQVIAGGSLGLVISLFYFYILK